MTAYIVLKRKELFTDFGIDFSDFPGCVTLGNTLDEAGKIATEVLALHVEGMLQDGLSTPEPSSLDTVMDNPENRDVVAFMVEVGTKAAKMKLATDTFNS